MQRKAREGDSRTGKRTRPALPPELVEALVDIGRVMRFPKHALIVIEGEPAETLYVVMAGKLEVFVSNDEGREILLNELDEGEYFGELMLDQSWRTASVRARTPVRLCIVRRDEFRRFLASMPDMALHLIQTLIHRVDHLTRHVQSLALMDVYGRVARLLLEQAVDMGGSRIVVGLSQQKVAERIGASRGMVNKIFKDLVRGGYITVGRRRIELRNELPRRW